MIELTVEQWQLLEGLTATVLPSDDAPGAVEAHVGVFLRRAFESGRWSARHELLTSGLRTLELLARSRGHRSFAACGPAERDEILARLQRLPHPQVRRFLALIVEMTLTGFLCDPRHGGNHDGAGWAAVGWQPRDPFAR